jgi:hypothetical protein
MKNRSILLLLSVLVLLVISAACAPAPVDKQEYSTEQVCKNIAALVGSIEKLEEGSAYADRNALSAQFDVVRRDFQALTASLVNLETVETQDFQAAVDSLIEAAGELPEDATVPDAIELLKEPIAGVRVAAEQLQTDLECK